MAKRKLSCFKDFKRALRSGYGLGAGDSYTPWIRVQDISSKGRSTKLPGIRVNRTHHLLSDIEKRLFLINEYCSVNIDLREQFPLLPLELAERIAEQIGVIYPIADDTGEPIVETTDLVLTRKNSKGISFLPIAAKESGDLLKTRVREKLEIERVWWRLLVGDWLLVTEKQLDRTVCENLDWLSDPLRGVKRLEWEEVIPSNARNLLFSKINIGMHDFESLVGISSKILKAEEKHCAKLIRAMMWERIFEVDLKINIQKTGIIRINKVNNVEVGVNSVKAAS
ncbi:MAG: hypothetical protein GY705_17235 [Bacteroidetes bacterium]|nr:hypothetical protein [Bacteroidota bacterium]